jgi:cysteine protease ATG4
MACYTCIDNTIYKDDVNRLCQEVEQDAPSNQKGHELVWRSLFLLLPLRLGVDFINPIYITVLKACLRLPQTVGIAGGRFNSSLYFIGHEGRIISSS